MHEPMNGHESPSWNGGPPSPHSFHPLPHISRGWEGREGGRQTTFVPLPAAMKLSTAPDECRMARPAARHLMPRAGLPTQRASKASNRFATSSGNSAAGAGGSQERAKSRCGATPWPRSRELAAWSTCHVAMPHAAHTVSLGFAAQVDKHDKQSGADCSQHHGNGTQSGPVLCVFSTVLI